MMTRKHLVTYLQHLDTNVELHDDDTMEDLRVIVRCMLVDLDIDTEPTVDDIESLPNWFPNL